MKQALNRPLVPCDRHRPRTVLARALLPLLALIAASLPAYALAEPQRTQFEPVVAPSLIEAGFDGLFIEYRLLADWMDDDGTRQFAAEITMLNRTGRTVDTWELGFIFPGGLTAAWNADIEVHGESWRIVPHDWNSRLAAGRSRSFGFSGTTPTTVAAPAAYTFTGSEATSAPQHFPALRCQLDVSFTIITSWHENPELTGFVARVHLENTGDEPVDWSLGLELAAEVTKVANAAFTTGDDALYVFSPLYGHQNTLLNPGETISFAVAGHHEDVLQEPRAVPCPPELAEDEDMDPAMIAYYRKYATLPAADRDAVRDGRLVWLARIIHES